MGNDLVTELPSDWREPQNRRPGVVGFLQMAETNSQRLDRLHAELAHLYRNKVDQSQPDRITYYWVRIDRLEDALARERALGIVV